LYRVPTYDGAYIQSDKLPSFANGTDRGVLYRVKTSGPLKTTKGSPDGQRNYWIVSEAEIDGPRIKARIAAPGSDWMRVCADGFLGAGCARALPNR
jgi:hypothetical protein